MKGRFVITEIYELNGEMHKRIHDNADLNTRKQCIAEIRRMMPLAEGHLWYEKRETTPLIEEEKPCFNEIHIKWKQPHTHTQKQGLFRNFLGQAIAKAEGK